MEQIIDSPTRNISRTRTGLSRRFRSCVSGLSNLARCFRRRAGRCRTGQVFQCTRELGAVLTFVCEQNGRRPRARINACCRRFEIIAGLGVLFKPKFFAYVVSAWLLMIVVNLLMIPGYYDIALRDFGLALGALALGRLSQKFNRGSFERLRE